MQGKKISVGRIALIVIMPEKEVGFSKEILEKKNVIIQGIILTKTFQRQCKTEICDICLEDKGEVNNNHSKDNSHNYGECTSRRGISQRKITQHELWL